MAVNDELRVGESVGEYEIESLIACGSTTTTYRARHRRLERVATLKLLHPVAFLDRPDGREHARRDAVVAASLEHPGIVPVYSAGFVGDSLYVVTAYVDGPTLAALVDGGAVSPSRCGEIIEQVASALEVAHAAGVVHGDVRPECILFGKWGSALLSEFGVTRTSGQTRLATRAELLETLRYAAPEQILGRPATPATDTYGLAATAVRCLTGQHPFADLPPHELVELRTEAPPPSLIGAAADSSRLNAVISAGMALDPAERPAGPSAFARRLRAAIDDLSAEVSAAPSPFALAAETVARRPSRDDRPAREAVPADATRVDRRRDVPIVNDGAAVGRSWATIGACAAAALACGLAAFGVGRVMAPDPPSLPRTGAFDLVTGDQWEPAEVPPPPFRIDAPVGLSARDDGAVSATAGGAEPPGPPGDPLPPEVHKAFHGKPEPIVLRAGERSLVRYTGGLVAGGKLTVFAVPSTNGTLIVSCRPRDADRCGALAANARLRAGRLLEPAPPAPATKAVAEALQRLERERATAVMGDDPDRAAVAEAANRLAAAFRDVAPTLDINGLDRGSAAQLASLREVMERAFSAYDALASAADRLDGSPYRRSAYAFARRRVLAAETRLRLDVVALARSGYTVDDAGTRQGAR
jgi:hypothetical protein